VDYTIRKFRNSEFRLTDCIIRNSFKKIAIADSTIRKSGYSK